jgi:hypothetical protein
MDERINVSPELITLRESKFYLELRPYILSLGAKYPFAQSLRIEEADDARIAPRDRFYFMADFIFGDIFTNIRTRRWIKYQLLDLIDTDHIDDVGAHFLLRAYLNELIILMERLQRLIELLAKGIADKPFIEALDLDVLRFFNPLLSDKRNHNHHELYLGYQRMRRSLATAAVLSLLPTMRSTIRQRPVAELNHLVARLAAAPSRAKGDALRQQIVEGFYGRPVNLAKLDDASVKKPAAAKQ